MLKKRGHNSRPTSPPPTVSTSRCKGEYAAIPGYHSANASDGQNEEQMAEATIGASSNLATATAAGWGVVATLTEANARLVKQLEDNSNELRELKALIKK
jgi:hypothetical protein